LELHTICTISDSFPPATFGRLELRGCFRDWRVEDAEKARASRGFPARDILFTVITCSVIAYEWQLSMRFVRATSVRRAQVQAEKQQAYEWIRTHLDSNSRLIAYDDTNLYLYTGRQSMTPLAFSTEGFYTGEPTWVRDLNQMESTPEYVQAQVWMFTPSDFSYEAGRDAMGKELDGRLNFIRTHSPILFRSSNGTVELHDVTCLSLANASCRPSMKSPVSAQ
jgi:hypothetical protein